MLATKSTRIIVETYILTESELHKCIYRHKSIKDTKYKLKLNWFHQH